MLNLLLPFAYHSAETRSGVMATNAEPRAAGIDTFAPMAIPGFRILRSLGSSCCRWVSLATDESTWRTVALKVMRTSATTDPATLRRFRHECRILAALESSNVSRTFKWGHAENRGFTATEYCPGGNLLERIRLRISMQDAVTYLAQILRGLEAVHAHGIFHRNIKPTNLLLREDGTLVLTDFGIERDLLDNSRLTGSPIAGSDLHYVSPESISNGLVDLRSDLYSAGMVFYHMLMGTESFNVAAMLETHRHAPIPKLPRPLGVLQPLLNGLLAKKPRDRFQSAADALDVIHWLTSACA